MGEKLLTGWDAIAGFFDVSRSTMQARKKDLQRAGVIFYKSEGRPPRRVVCAFPAELRGWIRSKALNEEEF